MYVQPFYAQVAVSEHWHRPVGLAGYVQRQVEHQMLQYAEEHGLPYFNVECIRHTSEYRPILNDPTVLWVHRGEWRPKSKTVEFEGGHLDGTTMQLEKPLWIINTAVAPAVPAPRWDILPVRGHLVAGSALKIAAYRRAGINPVTNRWVYVPA